MPTSDEDVKLLKTMIGAAKKWPVNIGICLGKKPENTVIVMDRKRAPDALGRAAKAGGETTKIAVGVVTVDGKNATLTMADKPPTGLTKQLKLYFKSIDLPMTFELLDPAGKQIPDDESAEIEDAGDPNAGADGSDEIAAARQAWEAAWANAEPDFDAALRGNVAGADKLRAVRDFMLGKAEANEVDAAQKSLQTLLGLIKPPVAPPTPGAGAQKTPGEIDPKALVEQLKAFKPQIALLSGSLAQLLNERYAKAVGLMKPATLTEAAAEITGIASALQGAGAMGNAPDNGPSATTTADASASPDQRLARIGLARDKLLGQVTGLTPGDAQDALLKIMDSVSESTAKGEPENALAGMKRVQNGLKLQAEIDRLAPLVAAAASGGQVADVNALNLLFNMVAEQVPAVDHARALANLAKVEQMIAEGAGGISAFASEVAEDVLPIAIAQLQWVNTRTNIRAEIGKLQAAITAALTEIGGMDDIISETGKLLDHVMTIDGRLEDKMNDVVNEPAGDTREALKQQARAILAEYQSEFSKPFFQEVDTGNGFADVDVAGSARVALARISDALAA